MAKKPNYLIYDDVRRDSSLRPMFEACSIVILDGSARLTKTYAPAGYSPYPCFRVGEREILTDAILEYYLSELGSAGFDYDKARTFSETMRRLCGWKWDVDRVLRNWVERVVRDPFFCDKNSSTNGWNEEWVLKPGEPSWQLSDDYLRFACYVAVNHVKYGDSCDQATANEIFGFIGALGSDLPARLKKHGSGDLPKEVLECKDDILSCKANDAFATIRIALKEESEQHYQKLLEYLCILLESDFPRSYSVEFRSPAKNWLPIAGLPKKGVHQLFANAVRWPGLHTRIERYARLAMHEFEWYNNLNNADCAMPGTFAVFALGLADEKYHTLVCDYLGLCDGEHQGLHGKFMLAYVEKYGITDKSKELYHLCEQNIQHLPPKLTKLFKSI